MNSSEWIDETLSPERVTSRKMFEDMKVRTVGMIRGAKDCKATRDEAWLFLAGLLYGEMPHMMGLINYWVGEVYKEDT